MVRSLLNVRVSGRRVSGGRMSPAPTGSACHFGGEPLGDAGALVGRQLRLGVEHGFQPGRLLGFLRLPEGPGFGAVGLDAVQLAPERIKIGGGVQPGGGVRALVGG